MNQKIQKIIPVICPKCNKQSAMWVDVITTTDLDGSHKTKGLATPKASCSCKELEIEFKNVYDKLVV